MQKQRWLRREDLAAFAKELREQAGKSKSQAARDLGVNRATIQQAEEMPETSLTKLRIRLIETYGPYQGSGPLYLAKR